MLEGEASGMCSVCGLRHSTDGECPYTVGYANRVQSQLPKAGAEVHAVSQASRSQALQAYWARWGGQRYYRNEGAGETMAEDQTSDLPAVDPTPDDHEGGGDLR